MQGGLQITVQIVNMYIHKGVSGPGVEPERGWGATAAAEVTLYRHPAPPRGRRLFYNGENHVVRLLRLLRPLFVSLFVSGSLTRAVGFPASVRGAAPLARSSAPRGGERPG